MSNTGPFRCINNRPGTKCRKNRKKLTCRSLPHAEYLFSSKNISKINKKILHNGRIGAIMAAGKEEEKYEKHTDKKDQINSSITGTRSVTSPQRLLGISAFRRKGTGSSG
jgi:hypothetical protein